MSEPASARLFFALWPEAGAVRQLAALQQSLRSTVDGRWLPLCKLHVTLVFLGQVSLNRLAELNTIAAGLSVPPFSLGLNRLEWWRRSQALCLTSGETPGGLNELVAGLLKGLEESGFRLEKRLFRAHLTLARAVTHGPPATQVSPPILLEPVAFSLVESRPAPRGSMYRSLGAWPLAGHGKSQGVSLQGAMR